ncbi:MAG: uroporphyrinogen decarboxylase family protein [Anaerolineaceae bacterium]|nr:uroporphyrinogen decarboxylase family protein [Anaerolineaceae bacterium]
MSSKLTSVERVKTVLNGGIPDRVPVDLHNFMMAAQDSGLSFPEYFQNGEAMAEGQINAWKTYGHDVLLLENGTVALAEACGCEVEYQEGSAPVLISPAIKSLDDVDKLVTPDPYKAHPLIENLKATKIVSREIGDQAYIMGRADQGPFSLASMLIGLQNFLFAIALPENRDKLIKLFDFCLEVVYQYTLAQSEQGAHMTSIGESLSGPDVCSPKVYKEYEWGYAKQLIDRLKAKGFPLAYHICGNATRIVPDMAATGAAVLELDYKCDLPAIKQAVLGKTTILGVIDPSGVLALGNPELVIQKVREELDILAPGGGLILGPGCALPPQTPSENIHAMIETTHRYGCYTSSGELIKVN